MANSDQVRPTWKVISSDGSDSETDIEDLEQTDSASCQLVSSSSGSNDTSTEHKRRVMVTCRDPEKNLKRSSATGKALVEQIFQQIVANKKRKQPSHKFDSLRTKLERLYF